MDHKDTAAREQVPLRSFVDERTLARRWNVHNRTLQRWRKDGKGPVWHKIGVVAQLTLDA